MTDNNDVRTLEAPSRAGRYITGLLLAGLLGAGVTQASDKAAASASSAIPWNQIGAKAGADYKGDGLAVLPTKSGASLHCLFQRLDGEATPEGLWLTSTVTNTVSDRFRIVAAAVGRPASHVALGLVRCGTVSVAGQTVRFIRPGLTEEYSVSMDGVRQDFIVEQAPVRPSDGELVVKLAVNGAGVEAAADGARLALDHSGRKIAYSRVRVTDATGKELPARIQVSQGRDEVTSLNFPDMFANEVKEQSLLASAPASGTLAVVVNDTGAVYPVRIDPTFSDANWVSLGGFPGASDRVTAALVDGSGNLYIGGGFTIVDSIVANSIVKWNGSAWSPLGSGFSGAAYDTYVFALAMSGSTLYAGGIFTNAGGVAATNIAQWNGSSWSALGSGVDGEVSALAVAGDTLYVGGGFTNAGGNAANNIAQWNGTNWSALGSGMSGGEFGDSSVQALAVSGSTLYACGDFTNAGGNAANNIAQWGGSSWSALGSGISGGDEYYPFVEALVVSGGNLYVGGFFTNAGGIAANNIAQWNGSNWSALGSGISGGDVLALAGAGSTVYAGGQFTTAGGNAANNIAQWNGSSWSALGSGMNSYSASVWALAVSGSTLYAGGEFSTAGTNAANNIAQWNATSWSALGSVMNGLNGDVFALAVSGGTLYAGGTFTTVGVNAANYIAQWDGSAWSALGSGMSGVGGYYPGIYALAVSGGTLYAGGSFTNAGGAAASGIAQWNGSAWSPLGSGMPGSDSFGPYVQALAVSGGTLYAGGSFTNAGGSGADYIAQWDGSNWSPLKSISGGDVYGPYVRVLLVSGGTLYAGGDFTKAGGNAATNIARWNGTSWSPLGSGLSAAQYYASPVETLAVSGGTLYAGGDFTNAGGKAANYIAQWNGTRWSPLGSGMSGAMYDPIDVHALAVSGGTLYAGGDFTTAGGATANNIAQWNGTNWSSLGSGMNSIVYALAMSGGTLYAGGDFTEAGGKVSEYAAEAYLIAPPGGLVDSIVLPSSGAADVNCYGNPGQQFGVQRTTNLSPPLWTNVNSSPLIPAPDGSFTFTDTNAPPGAAFYRAFQY